jgi:hypothetical protein
MSREAFIYEAKEMIECLRRHAKDDCITEELREQADAAIADIWDYL